MKIVLFENIKNLGKKYEIKDIKAGFFRNYLLPNKLAKILDKNNLLWLKKNQKIIQAEKEKEIQEINKIINYIKKLNLVIFVKIGRKGQLFEKITNISIAEELNNISNYIFNKKQILIDPIKKIGEYKIKILIENKDCFLNLKIKDEKLKKR